MDNLALSDGEFGITFCQPLRAADGWLDSFVVQVLEPGLSATARVENSRYIQGAELFFSELAQNWRGWTGEKTWRALDGELDLVATSDSLGHIKVRVGLRPDAGAEIWRVVSYAYLEAGQLDFVSSRAQLFFGREP
jgi:hypothetical protein